MAASRPEPEPTQTTRLSVRLDPVLHDAIRVLVAEGRFFRTSDVLRAGLRAAVYQPIRPGLALAAAASGRCSTRESVRFAAGVRRDLQDAVEAGVYESEADAIRSGVHQVLARHQDVLPKEVTTGE